MTGRAVIAVATSVLLQFVPTSAHPSPICKGDPSWYSITSTSGEHACACYNVWTYVVEVGGRLLQAVTAAATEKLDVQLAASGFKKEHFSALDSYVSALQGMVAPRNGSGVEESDGSDESDDESDTSECSGEEAGSEGEGEGGEEDEGGEGEGKQEDTGCSGRSAVATDVSKSGARSEGRGPDQDASTSKGAVARGEACKTEVRYQLPEDSINGLSIAQGEGEPRSQQQIAIPP